MMKINKVVAACFVLASILLVSCLDTEEKITVNEDKSGIYQLSITIANSPMLQSAMQQSGQQLEKKDTVIYFKGFTDTATTLTAEEKAVLEKGKLHVAMNEDIKAEFELPFSDMQQLQYIKQHMFDMISKIKPPDGGGESMFPGMGNGAASGMGGAGQLFTPAKDAVNFTIDNNLISNKIKDTAAFRTAFASDTMQNIKQMLPFIGDLTYRTTFVLPAPVKNYSGGAETKISDDKKTISFINSLSGLLDNPNTLEYSVEY